MNDASSPSKLLAYLRLFRLPNVFTAMADIAMGFLFIHGSFEPLPPFLCLLGATCFLYTAGMVLNDVYDFDVDSEERPQRPLPSGQISLSWARQLGYGMLLIGVGLGWLAGFVQQLPAAEDAEIIPWRSGAVATLLAVFILLYDAVLKRTPLGPLAMGVCRFLNVLLGMSVAVLISENSQRFLSYDISELSIAAGIGIYIVGVTWFARREAGESRSIELVAAIGVMVSGVFILATGAVRGRGQLVLVDEIIWPALLFLVTVTIVRRCMSAALNPTPRHVQIAIKQCILSLIILDAAVCLAFVAPYWWSLCVLALLAPMIVLGKWVYST